MLWIALGITFVYAEDATAWSEKGDAACKLGQYQLGIDDYTKAIQADPQSDQNYLLRAVAERLVGKFKEFFSDVERAIQLNPSNFEGYVLRASTYDSFGNFPEAINDYSAALKIYPAYTDSLYARGVDKTRIGDAEGAIADFTEVVQQKPQMIQGYLGRGGAYQAEGAYDKAIADYNAILHIKPDAIGVYVLRASALDCQGDDTTALSDLDDVLNKDPSLLPAHMQRGFIYFRMGKDDDALKEIQTFVDNTNIIFNANSITPLFLLWILQVEVNHDVKTANLELRHFGPPQSKTDSQKDWRLVLNRCFLGQATEADVYKALGPDDPTVADFYLGMKHVVQGDKPGGIALLTQVLGSKFPGTPEVHLAKARLEMLK